MKRHTYEQYRSYGHTPLTAFILARDPIRWYIAAAIDWRLDWAYS
jgi:hypothetical protein